MMVEEIYKAINSIGFSLLSPSEIRKMSVVEVQTADTYDEDGVPIPSGLMDGRLGTLEPRQKCRTCGNTATNCPGHFGHIELAEPSIHVSFVKVIYRLIMATCRSCGRIKLSNERVSHYLNEINKKQIMLNTIPDGIYDEIYKEAKKSHECFHCGAEQYDLEYIKPTTFHELREGGAVRLTPGAIREWLERISNEDLTFFGINHNTARPEWTILQTIPVPPVTVRPSITLESGVRSEDDLTHKLVDIIRINQKLKEALDSGVPVNIIQELHDLLQYHVTTYFDNEVAGIPPARHRSGRALKTLSQRLKGKEGRFRGNLSGKRVDFSARTVISPDPNLELNEVGIPIALASKLTVPVKVTPWNVNLMKQLVRNGPNKYPGALYIIRPDDRRIRLEFVAGREELADALEPGFVVERHLKNRDIVLFNRQPSLHRMSIMAHKVKVLPYKTFRLNPCVCPPYNADFDGDEMNLHVPQSEEARTEAELLMQVQDQILSPRYGGPIIGAIRDHLSASYLLTHKSTYLTKSSTMKLLAAFNYEGAIPEPSIKRPTELWSGKQIFSLFLPEDLNFISKSSICSMYKCDTCLKEKCPHDAYVIVKNGKLIKGIIDKASIGAEKSESLFHRIVKDYDPNYGKQFLDSISKVLDRFITLRGFTYSLDELEVSDSIQKDIQKVINKAENNTNDLITKYGSGKLDRLPGKTMEESLEIFIMNELSKARDDAGECVENNFTLENSGIIMAATGARGSMLNIGQMSACLGQQSIRGKRISRGYRGRALPFFKSGETGPAARGFVYSCYRKGLDPIEFFFHAMGGREGLVDTAVRTQQSGYMQRRLINALEHLRVEYDGTVRDSGGNIIQFEYGEDGIDAAKSDHGKAVNIDHIINRIKLRQEGNKKTPIKYTEKSVDEVSDKLSPILKENLVNVLKESKLSQKSVKEAIKITLKNYRRSLIEPGEATGIVSAQSIGEPGTQMTLRTFHFAGVKERNVTLGLPRLIEIVDARKTPSTPSMTVYLDKAHRRKRESAEKVAKNITFTNISDIAEGIETDIVNTIIKIKLNQDKMKNRDISFDEVYNSLSIPHCNVVSKKQRITITVKGRDVAQFKRLVKRITELKVKGLKEVDRTLLVEEGNEWILITEGSNLKSVMTIPGVDFTRTISNNIHEVAGVLGIEAARNVIMTEAIDVLEEQGLDVDIRHVMLVADAMTASGEVLSVGRHGISGGKTSTLARAAFEITVPTLVDSSLKGTKDQLKGVAENVIVGQQIPMGTGLIEVYMSLNGQEMVKDRKG